jgi:hypothetical protein
MNRCESLVDVAEVFGFELPREMYGGTPYSEPDPGVEGGVLARDEAEDDPLESQLVSMAGQAVRTKSLTMIE